MKITKGEYCSVEVKTSYGTTENWVRFSGGQWLLWMGCSLEQMDDQPELEFEFQKLTKPSV